MALFFINIKEQQQKANKTTNKIIDRDQDMSSTFTYISNVWLRDKSQRRHYRRNQRVTTAIFTHSFIHSLSEYLMRMDCVLEIKK